MRLPAGYGSRPATKDDLEAMAEVANAYDVVDLGEPDTSVEHLEQSWQGEGFDERSDTLLVHAGDGSPAAFGLLEVWPDAPIEVFGRVHPAHAGRGLGAGLLEWSEERARARAREREVALRLHNGVTATDRAARRLLEDRGYRVVRVFRHMERSLEGLGGDPPGSPAGLSLRRAVDDDLEAVRRTMDESLREHWEWRPRPVEEWRRHAAAAAFGAVLARDGQEPVGAVTFQPTARSGWIEEIGVRPAWRGRGLGEALLRHAFVGLRELGMDVARLNVDADNATGATRLYERAGMHVRREWLVHEKAVPVDVS